MGKTETITVAITTVFTRSIRENNAGFLPEYSTSKERRITKKCHIKTLKQFMR
jgi:hypothetical protein